MTNQYSILDSTQHRLGNKPRDLSLWTNTLLKYQRPVGLATGDNLNELITRFDEFMRLGDLMLGHIIQADESLWHEGNYIGRATVMCPCSPGEYVWPHLLERAAIRVGRLRTEKSLDPRCVEITEILEGKTHLVNPHRLPEELCPIVECELRGTLVRSEDLPTRHISTGLLPLLVLRDVGACLVLPLDCWHKELIQTWKEWSVSDVEDI